MKIILLSIGAIVFVCMVALVAEALMILMLAPRRGEVPEDEGPDYDAGVKHVCSQCGLRISGPEDGLRIPDCECWACYCARRSPGEVDAPVRQS